MPVSIRLEDLMGHLLLEHGGDLLLEQAMEELEPLQAAMNAKIAAYNDSKATTAQLKGEAFASVATLVDALNAWMAAQS